MKTTTQPQNSIVSTRPRCMVVDDDALVLEMTATVIESLAGFEVVRFTSPAEALRVFEKSPGEFSLVVTDFNMPGLDGLEFGRRIAATAPDVDLVMVTGSFAGMTSDKLQRAGFRCMVPKPYHVHVLAEVVRPRPIPTVTASTAMMLAA